MRKLVHKLFWAWEYEKEEKWLNEMSAKGLCLASVGFCRYEFEPCLPGEYAFRLEFLENYPSHAESEQYITFLEETGAKHIGSLMRWAYFRKKTADGPFDLFSDNSSRIKHLNRILLLIGILSGINIYFGLNSLYLFFIMHSNVNVVGFLNIFLGAALALGFWRIYRKKKRLIKEQQIFE